MPTEPLHSPSREVFREDALVWLTAHAASPVSSVLTSLPDSSELPEMGFDVWRSWFTEVAEKVIAWLPAEGVAIFYQSDVRHAGVWVDKSHLVLRAADALKASLVWHKIICRKLPGTITHGRASYSHMLCLSKTQRPTVRRPGPDVILETNLPRWSKAMGVDACRVACRFLRAETATRVVVDPFCGRGTALAVANSLGFEAIGIDRSARCCRAARRLSFDVPEPASL